jgi:hypothetical protein
MQLNLQLIWHFASDPKTEEGCRVCRLPVFLRLLRPEPALLAPPSTPLDRLAQSLVTLADCFVAAYVSCLFPRVEIRSENEKVFSVSLYNQFCRNNESEG